MTDPLTKHQDILRGEQIFRAMLNKARSDTIKAAYFDSLMKALVHGTGEYRNILAKARVFYEREPRARIEARRRQEQ